VKVSNLCTIVHPEHPTWSCNQTYSMVLSVYKVFEKCFFLVYHSLGKTIA
jgi:hypothetical protein